MKPAPESVRPNRKPLMWLCLLGWAFALFGPGSRAASGPELAQIVAVSFILATVAAALVLMKRGLDRRFAGGLTCDLPPEVRQVLFRD